MTKIANKSAKCWLMLTAVAVYALSASASFAAAAGADDAGNYTSVTFTNGSNEGTGFGAWEFNLGEGSFIGLTNSAAGSDDINSGNGFSFSFYGGTNGSFGEAIRAFNAPMIEGDEFTATIAYNYSGGARGMNILDASNTELLNVNFGGSDELSYTFQGESGVVIASNYLSDASIVFTITQLAGNALELAIERNDGFITNLTSGSLSSPAAKMKFYNGGHVADDISYALFVNDLELIESTIPTLGLAGRDAMAAGMTNALVVTRGGVIGTEAVINISNTDELVATVPSSVSINTGETVTNFLISGLDLGETTIEITSEGYPTSSLAVAVYDLGYDDSSYAAGSFTNGGNSGLGFQPWIFTENDGAGDGYTNFAGTFIGNSTANGGGDVNASSGDAFALYANQEGTGDAPFFNAIRQFDNELAVGEAISLEFGVNYRNGSKGVAFQNGGGTIFEVGVFADDYWYVNPSTTNGAVSLGWDYAADTAIEIELARVAPDVYDITIVRTGSMPETNDLGLVDLSSTAPNEVRAYIYGTDAGGENNLYFNDLALYSSYTIPVLTLQGEHGGQVVNYTNVMTVSHSGSVAAPFTVDIASSVAGVLTVPVSVVIPPGTNQTTFEVVGASNGLTTVSVSAINSIGDDFDVDVFDVAYDDSSYYDATSWVDASNAGVGFTNWILINNDGPGDGFTNFAGNVLADSSVSAGDVNSASNNAFALFASKEGSTGTVQESSAIRIFDNELGINQKLSADISVNYRNGSKGIVVQDGGAWLFEIAVLGDDYQYRNWGAGDTQFTSLGWVDYSADTAIRLELSRVAGDSYDVVITRSGGFSASNVLSGVSLGGNVPDELRFYTYSTDAGPENYLYFNRLAINSFPGAGFTDGIPDSWWNQYGIAASNRVAGTDLEPDGKTSWQEYIADTNPNDAGSFLDDKITTLDGADLLTLTIGPTTNSRVYDIWWNDDLLEVPQAWTRYGLNVVGDGTVLSLTVTNGVSSRSYRTGVALP